MCLLIEWSNICLRRSSIFFFENVNKHSELLQLWSGRPCYNFGIKRWVWKCNLDIFLSHLRNRRCCKWRPTDVVYVTNWKTISHNLLIVWVGRFCSCFTYNPSSMFYMFRIKEPTNGRTSLYSRTEAPNHRSWGQEMWIQQIMWP